MESLSKFSLHLFSFISFAWYASISFPIDGTHSKDQHKKIVHNILAGVVIALQNAHSAWVYLVVQHLLFELGWFCVKPVFFICKMRNNFTFYMITEKSSNIIDIKATHKL